MTASKPVLLLGLDGAGWPVLEPLLAGGSLPFLATLMENGAWGTLMSPWPGSTFPSWTSIMTGVPPGVHGMLDFTEFDPATYSVRFVDSRARRVPALWEIAHRQGKRCAVLGVPGTFPPDTDVDLMISGFDTPVTTSIEPSFVHPSSWRRRLAEVGGFPLTPVQELRIGRAWHTKAWQALQTSIDGKTRVGEYVLRHLRPDLFILVFGESDTVCHHFWQFHDPRSPRAGRSHYAKDAITDIYARLDHALARIVEAAGDPALVMVVSDHGFGGAGIDSIHLNRFLAEQGFMRFSGRPRWQTRFSPVSLAALLPRRAQQWVFRRARTMVGGMESRRRVAGIRWGGTVAYSEELPYAPAVRLNLRGREGLGVVDPGQYETVRDEIISALRGWRDAETGAPVVERVWRREELMRGPSAESMPDILLDLATPGGYSYVVSPSGGRAGPVQVRLDPSMLRGAKGTGMGGSHRREGVVIVKSDLAQPGPAGITGAGHVAAAVMAGLGVPAPPWMGLPPQAFPQPELLATEDDTGTFRVDIGDLSWEWERLTRLRGLGYLD